jgi:hypothetical protein
MSTFVPCTVAVVGQAHLQIRFLFLLYTIYETKCFYDSWKLFGSRYKKDKQSVTLMYVAIIFTCASEQYSQIQYAKVFYEHYCFFFPGAPHPALVFDAPQASQTSKTSCNQQKITVVYSSPRFQKSNPTKAHTVDMYTFQRVYFFLSKLVLSLQ